MSYELLMQLVRAKAEQDPKFRAKLEKYFEKTAQYLSKGGQSVRNT